MKVNIELLKREIAQSGKTKERFAKEIGIDYSTFTRKMKRSALTFTVGQMHKITEVLNLSDSRAMEIFFTH